MEKSHTELWAECLQIVKDNIPAEQFECWFKPVAALRFVDEPGKRSLTLSVPSPYFVEYLEARFVRIIGYVVRRVFGEGVSIYYHYNQVSDRPDTAVNLRSTNPSETINAEQLGTGPFEVKAEETFKSHLNPLYNFANYCESTSNKLARSIGRTLADNPRVNTFNPLFIFGPTGVGKTHLIQAIGIGIKEHNPQMRVLYISARLFESQFTVASRNGRINDFIAFYQTIDTLIIDDIQDLINKEKTQGAFFHIFNHLRMNQRQIIMSCDQRPTDLKGMQERLLSRFKSGMTVELLPPDLELRKEVLQLKNEQDGLDIPEEVMDYIAANVTNNIRELEGVVTSLVAHATYLNRDLDMALARNVVANAIRVSRPSVSFETIMRCVCAFYDIDTDSLYSKCRKRNISDARQMVMYLAKKHLKMPLKAIGTRLERKHATVLHGCRNIEERLAVEKQLQADISAIEQSFAGIDG